MSSFVNDVVANFKDVVLNKYVKFEGRADRAEFWQYALVLFRITFSNEKRGVSIKVTSWMISIALILFNVIFSLFEYRIDIYIASALLLSVVGCALIYALYSAKSGDNR